MASEVLRTDIGMTEEASLKGGEDVRRAVIEDREERGASSPNHPENVPLTALGQPFAIFRHSSEFTEQEDAVIAHGLLAQLPVYIIADKLGCSRQLLARHIQESKLLSQVWVDRKESFLDNVEWQARKLIDSGNPAMIMFALQTIGKDRGWGQNQAADVDMDDTRIVIGEIPESEVEAAEKKVKEIESEFEKEKEKVADHVKEKSGVGDGGGKIPSPMEMALMEDAAKKAAEEVQREREANTVTVPPEDVRVEPVPWDDGYVGGDNPFGGGGFGGGGFDGFM